MLTYEVSGTATKASISYITDGFGDGRETDASVPWTKTVSFRTGIGAAIVIAQNLGGGSITCNLKKDGEVISTHTSTGDLAITSCAYS